MTIKKYFSIQSLFYLVIYFSPVLLSPFSPSNRFSINFTTVSYLLGAMFLLYFNRLLDETPKIEQTKLAQRPATVILWGIGGIFLAFATQIGAIYLEHLLGITELSQNTENIVQLIRQSPFFLMAVSIAGPIMEELVFRRGIIGLLSQYFPLLISAMISALLFALVHADGHLLLYFSLGMVFYFLYQKTGSIWTSIITHCSMNFLVMVIQFSQL